MSPMDDGGEGVIKAAHRTWEKTKKTFWTILDSARTVLTSASTVSSSLLFRLISRCGRHTAVALHTSKGAVGQVQKHKHVASVSV